MALTPADWDLIAARLQRRGYTSLSNRLINARMVAYAPSIVNPVVRTRFLALAAYILAHPDNCYQATFDNTLAVTHHPNASLVVQILACFAPYPLVLRRVTQVLKPLYPTITTGWSP